MHLDPADGNGSEDQYNYNISIQYDDENSLKAELFGHYVWWDMNTDWDEKKDEVIFDLNVTKRLWGNDKSSQLFLFACCHNVFDGEQYSIADYRNPGRWFEAGIRIKF